MIINIHAKVTKVTNKTFNPDYPKYQLLVALSDWATKLSVTTEKDIFNAGDEIVGEIDINAISGTSKSNGTYYEINECRDLDLKIVSSIKTQKVSTLNTTAAEARDDTMGILDPIDQLI